MESSDRSFWDRPPGLPLTSAALAVLAINQWAGSVPGDYFDWWLTAIAAAVGVAGMWFFRLAVALVRLSSSGPSEWRWRARWLLVPCIGLVTCGLSLLDLSERARFALSRGALDTTARELVAGVRDPATVDRIGLIPVEDVRVDGGTVRFVIPGAGFLSPIGYLYDPQSATADLVPLREHVDGPWFVWWEDW